MNNDFETRVKEKTNNELSEIYLNANKYQPEFVKLVELELLERKIPLDSLSYIRMKKDEIDDDTLQMGKQGSQFWIITAFLISLIGGLWGIVAGYQYAYSKHKNASGVEYFVYNESTRKYGRWMLIVGGTVIGLAIFSNIL